MSKWDKEYLKLCKKILTEGIEVENRTGTNAIKLDGYYLEFDVEKEFPFLTTKQLICPLFSKIVLKISNDVFSNTLEIF